MVAMTKQPLRREVVDGDCLDVLADEPENAFDSCVTDPPYGLSFMGRAWDHGVPGVPFWQAHLRVLKPGAHLLAFGGTRTFHRLTCAIEDAGFEIRDCIMWVYGSGFPKSLDVAKALDAAAGVRGAIVGRPLRPDGTAYRDIVSPPSNALNGARDGELNDSTCKGLITAPASDLAKQWDGWGTALKPAWEPIIVARKPLVGTVAANVTAYGTGAINIDACRVPASTPVQQSAGRRTGWQGEDTYKKGTGREYADAGRHPANLIHDGSPDVEAVFAKAGERDSGGPSRKPSGHYLCESNNLNCYGKDSGAKDIVAYNDRGTASRFFYCAKANKAGRGEGNDHPTVKPNALMRYLTRLVTPPGGIVLDGFCGSGSTLKAAMEEGFGFVGIDADPHAVDIACRRTGAT